MQLRYKLVTFHFGQDASGRQTLQRHYQTLMDELLRQGQHPAVHHRAVQWRPPADIHETRDVVRVKIELAGMREEDIEITLYQDALVVTGRRDDDAEHDDAVCYHEAQIRYGPFRAEILLPGPIRRDEVEARYENGFLCVTLPKVTGASLEERPVDAAGSARREAGRRDKTSQPLQAGPRVGASEAHQMSSGGPPTEERAQSERGGPGPHGAEATTHSDPSQLAAEPPPDAPFQKAARGGPADV